jgi:hypothetical protein
MMWQTLQGIVLLTTRNLKFLFFLGSEVSSVIVGGIFVSFLFLFTFFRPMAFWEPRWQVRVSIASKTMA